MWSHIAAYRPKTTATTTMTTAMKITDKLRFKHSVVSHFWRTVINMFGTFDSSHNIVPHKKRDQNLLCKNVVGKKTSHRIEEICSLLMQEMGKIYKYPS